MSGIEHPTAKVLNMPVVTHDGDFEDMASCDTVLGPLYFNRYNHRDKDGKPGTDYWKWGINTAVRQIDDFDSLDDDTQYRSLEEAAHKADRSLRGLLRPVTKARSEEYKAVLRAAKALKELQAADADDLRQAMYEGHRDGLCAVEGPARLRRLENALTEAEAAVQELAKLPGW